MSTPQEGPRVYIRRRGMTHLPNGTVHDPRLSYQALGLLTVLLSRPDGAPGGYRNMQGRGLGESATRRALRELTDLGYRHQIKRRAEGGRWVTVTVVSEEPITAEMAAEWMGLAPVDNAGEAGVDNGDRAVESTARSDLRKRAIPAGGTVQRSTTARSAVARSSNASLRAKVSSLRSETEEANAAQNDTHDDVGTCPHGAPARLTTKGLPVCPLCRLGAKF